MTSTTPNVSEVQPHAYAGPKTERPACTALTDIGLLLIRAMPAIVLMFHGSQKLFGAFGGPGLSKCSEMFGQMGFPAPMVSAALAASAEFFGGLLVLVGLGTRLAVIPMAFTMLVASFVVHRNAFSLQYNGMEFALTLALVLIGIGFTGPGRLSISGLLRGRK